jgi:hypothetical protein
MPFKPGTSWASLTILDPSSGAISTSPRTSSVSSFLVVQNTCSPSARTWPGLGCRAAIVSGSGGGAACGAAAAGWTWTSVFFSARRQPRGNTRIRTAAQDTRSGPSASSSARSELSDGSDEGATSAVFTRTSTPPSPRSGEGRSRAGRGPSTGRLGQLHQKATLVIVVLSTPPTFQSVLTSKAST